MLNATSVRIHHTHFAKRIWGKKPFTRDRTKQTEEQHIVPAHHMYYALQFIFAKNRSSSLRIQKLKRWAKRARNRSRERDREKEKEKKEKTKAFTRNTHKHLLRICAQRTDILPRAIKCQLSNTIYSGSVLFDTSECATLPICERNGRRTIKRVDRVRLKWKKRPGDMDAQKTPRQNITRRIFGHSARQSEDSRSECADRPNGGTIHFDGNFNAISHDRKRLHELKALSSRMWAVLCVYRKRVQKKWAYHRHPQKGQQFKTLRHTHKTYCANYFTSFFSHICGCNGFGRGKGGRKMCHVDGDVRVAGATFFSAAKP